MAAKRTCKRCSECRDLRHHWIDGDMDSEEAPTHVCKHCDAVGDECPICDGDGERFVGDSNAGLCTTCDGYGVVERIPTNARLIAAAPEMAALLREFRERAFEDTSLDWNNRVRALLARIDPEPAGVPRDPGDQP